MRKYDVITVMDICADLIVSGGDVVPKFGQAEQLVNEYTLEMGGAACIFACQTAKLGLKTLRIGKTGRDAFGSLVLQRLNAAGVDTSRIAAEDGMKTGLGIALINGNDRAILTCTGTIDAAGPQLLDEELIKQTHHLHVASYFLLKKMQSAWPGIAKLCKKHRVTVSLDPNWDPLEKWDSGILSLLDYTDIFMPNQNELIHIAGECDQEHAAEKLLERVPVIAVKKGTGGAVLYTRDAVYRESAFDTGLPYVDSVGAGDSFNGGFICGFLGGRPIEDCLKLGCVCGAYSVTKSGGIKGQTDMKGLNDLKGLIAHEHVTNR